MNVEEAHDVHWASESNKVFIYHKIYSACKPQTKQAICMLPAQALPAICMLLVALTALAESQMCLRGI